MSGTKIGSHRIADKSILKTHLSDSLELREGEHVKLNHPTHTNAYDLNLVQYNVLTQGGNADQLHSHTGGGGGEFGIYTNKQRDSMLLELLMLMSAQMFRLENSISEDFNDSYGIDFGYAPPVVNSLEEILSELNAKTLEPETTYSYRVAQRIKNKTTNASVPRVKRTSNLDTSPYRRIKLEIITHPENSGITIWRSKNVVSMYEMYMNNTYIKTYDGLDFRMTSESLYPNVGGSILVPFSRSGMANQVRNQASVEDGGIILGLQPNSKWNGELTDTISFGYRNSNSIFAVHKLSIVFSTNPGEIPRDLIVEYTTSPTPDIKENETWVPVTGMALYTVDGTYESGVGYVSGNALRDNTKAQVSLSFDHIQPTGMRVVVTSHLGSVRYTSFIAEHNADTTNKKVFQYLDGTFDLTTVSSVQVDVKSKEAHNVFSVGFGDESQTQTESQNERQLFSNTSNGTSVGASSIRTYRTIVPVANANYSQDNKIKIRFDSHTSWDTKIVDVTVATATSQTSTLSPGVVRRVTFNNGLLEGHSPLGESVLETDWIDINFPNSNINYIVVSLKITSGNLYTGGAVSSYYTWYRDNDSNASFDESGGNWIAQWTNYSFIRNVKVSTGYRRLFLDEVPLFNRDDWYTHYINIENIKSNYTKLNRLIYAIGAAQSNDTVMFSYPRMVNQYEYVGRFRGSLLVTASSSDSSFPRTNGINGALSSYWLSQNVPTLIAPENYMIKFPQLVAINKIRFVANHSSYAPMEYEVQWTDNATATVNDPTDSGTWYPVYDLAYGVQARPQLQGQIIDGRVHNALIEREYIEHLFSSKNVLALRIVFYRIKNELPAMISDFKIYTALEDESYEVVYNSTTKEPTMVEFIDDVLVGSTTIPIPIENGTGSTNILYDKRSETIRSFDQTRQGVFISNLVDTPMFNRCLLRVQSIDNDNSIVYYVTNNGGATWTEMVLGEVMTLTGYGTQFRFKAVLQPGDMLSAYALIHAL